MTLDDLTSLLAENQVVNFSTYRRDGRPQMSLVTVGRLGETVAFTTRQRNAKYANLMRDPRCAMMIFSADRRTYAVLDGDAQVLGTHNTDPAELRATLRDVYRASAGKEHPNWDEYDAAMYEQKRVAILLNPVRIYAHGM